MLVSADYFEVFGVKAALGRTFLPGEDQPGADPCRRPQLMRRGRGVSPAIPRILHRDIVLDGEPHQVVGILPAGSFDR